MHMLSGRDTCEDDAVHASSKSAYRPMYHQVQAGPWGEDATEELLCRRPARGRLQWQGAYGIVCPKAGASALRFAASQTCSASGQLPLPAESINAWTSVQEAELSHGQARNVISHRSSLLN